MKTPRELGYRLPAEWESQEGVWLSWPTNRSTWLQCWDEVQATFVEIALKMSQYQTVFINLALAEQVKVKNLLCALENELGLVRGELRFFDHPSDDVWVRDHGPIYLNKNGTGEIALTDWQFNGWGEKYPHELDNQIPARIQESSGHLGFKEALVLEGGSIETNGAGDLLVTTDCLLNENRNPNTSREEIERKLMENLGVGKVHWLNGCLEGDDTDGHIDNLVRFYKEEGVLVAAVADENDSNYDTLERLRDQCIGLQLLSGIGLTVKTLPLPAPIIFEGRRLPMSYLNFFIGNEFVLMPTFGQPDSDAEAIETLSTVFPDRAIIPIDCCKLILEGGALHCLTQQVPRVP